MTLQELFAKVRARLAKDAEAILSYKEAEIANAVATAELQSQLAASAATDVIDQEKVDAAILAEAAAKEKFAVLSAEYELYKAEQAASVAEFDAELDGKVAEVATAEADGTTLPQE